MRLLKILRWTFKWSFFTLNSKMKLCLLFQVKFGHAVRVFVCVCVCACVRVRVYFRLPCSFLLTGINKVRDQVTGITCCVVIIPASNSLMTNKIGEGTINKWKLLLTFYKPKDHIFVMGNPCRIRIISQLCRSKQTHS